MKAITVIALCVLVPDSKAKCPSGGAAYNPAKNNYPVVDRECFKEDLDTGHKTAYPGDCQSYFYCNPDKCEWHRKSCGDGKYWNNVEGKCVAPEEADCGGALFWSGVLMQIWNVEFDKVLDDCRSCGGSERTDPTPVIVFKWKDNPEWNQLLLAKRRRNSQYYSLAFDVGHDDDVKVIQDLGKDKVTSKMLAPARPRPSEWRFVPIPGKKSKIQVISVATGKAMAIIRDKDDREYYVRSTNNINPQDKKQQWIVKDLNKNAFTYLYE